MKLKFLVIFLMILLILPIVNSLEFDNRKYFDENVGNYGKVTIKDWFGLLDLATLELKTNTDVCLIECSAEKEIIMYQDGILIDDIRFETIKKDNSRTIEPIKEYNFYIKQNDDWIFYNLGTEVKKGTYQVRLEGKKDLLKKVDWKIKSQGIWIDEWLIWGTNPPIAYFNFDETTGTNLENKVDGTYNGTLYEMENDDWVPGLLGNALNFDGTDDFVNITNMENLGLINDTTISVWVNTSGVYGAYSAFVNLGSNRFAYRSYVSDTLGIMWATPGGGLYSPDYSLINDTWVHIVLTQSTGWVNTTNSLIYVDGIKVDTTGGSFYQNLVGSFELGVSSATGSHINATLDELGIWDNVLTQAEVTELYNAGAGLVYGIPETLLTLISPANNTNQTNSNINFTGYINTTASEGLKNATFNVWYSNGTLFNSTLKEISGTDNATILQINDFTINNYLWNILACSENATDSFCNQADENFSFFARTVINSINYNVTEYETSTKNININITAFGNVTPTNAYLNYNGTEFTATVTPKSNGNFILDRSISFNSTMIGNNSFFFNWSIGEYSEQSFNSNQTIKQVFFGICNSTLNVPYINFTFLDEDDNMPIENATITLSNWNFWIDNEDLKRSYSFTNTTGNSKYAFCFSPNDTTIRTNFTMQYKDQYGIYPQRTLTNETTLTNSTTNRTLYLLSSADGIYVTFQVLNQAEQAIAEVKVTAKREIDGITVTVGEGTTGEDGGVTFWLNPDFIHTFTFIATGYDTYTTSLIPTQTSYTIQLGSETAGWVGEDYTKGISYSILPLPGVLKNNTVYNFNLTISSAYWEVDSFGFSMYSENATKRILVGSTSLATNGGTVGLDIDTGNNETFEMNYYWVINGTYNNGTTAGWLIFDETTGSEWSILMIKNFLIIYINSGMFGLDNFGLTIILFLTIFISTGIMSYKFGLTSPAAISVLAFTLILFFDVGLDLMDNINPIPAVPHFPTIFMGLIFAGIFLKEATQ